MNSTPFEVRKKSGEYVRVSPIFKEKMDLKLAELNANGFKFNFPDLTSILAVSLDDVNLLSVKRSKRKKYVVEYKF